MKVGTALAAAVALLGLPAGALAAPDGAALFVQNCAMCHQADASGAAGLAPPLKGEHWAKLGTDRSYIPTVVLNGLFGPIKLGSGDTFAGNMPSFAQTLDDATIAAIASHVSKIVGGDDGGGYSADDIKAVRQLPGSPTQSRQKRSRLVGS